MVQTATALGEALKDGFVAGVTGALGMAGDITQAVLEGIKDMINKAIDALNAAIPDSIKIPVPGAPDISINLPNNPIPRLARGGVVVAGDNPSGIEAIVPLERAHEFGFGGGRGEQHLHFHGPVVGSVDWLLRELHVAAQRAGKGGILNHA